MAILVGAFLLGILIEYVQIRLTGWLILKKRRMLSVFGIALKAAVWAGMFFGMFRLSVNALMSCVAGCAVFTLGYAIAHFVSVRREE